MAVKAIRASLLLAVLAAIGTWVSADPAGAVSMTFTVNSGADTGTGDCVTPTVCTLRDAINAANLNGGADTILFDQNIALITPGVGGLPAIDAADGITIDGSGANVEISAVLDESPNGLFFFSELGTAAQDVTVRNLMITNFSRGIFVCGGYNGIDCAHEARDVTVEDAVLFSSTRNGLAIWGTNVSGVAVDGTIARNSDEDGVVLNATQTVSDVTMANSQIRLNAENGLKISGFLVSSVTLEDVDVDENDEDGVKVEGGSAGIGSWNVIGGSASENEGDGYDFSSDEVDSLFFQGGEAKQNGENGVFVSANASGSTLTFVGFDASENSFVAASGVRLVAGQSLDGLSVQQSTFSMNQDHGFFASAPEVNNVSMADNTANGNGMRGLQVEATVETKTGVEAVGNTANENGLQGIAFGGRGVSGGMFSENEASGNGAGGITLDYNFISGSSVIANVASDNGADGIWVSGAAEPAGEANLIADNLLANNDRVGVYVSDGGPYTISRNSTFGNAGLGIDLVTDLGIGVTLNDPGDGDSGANGLLNFPVLTGSSDQTVAGTACAGCIVEVFVSDSDPSGYGEGETFISDVTANGSGEFSAPICGQNLLGGTQMTATATDPAGNTSEFSLNYPLQVASGLCPATPTPSATATPVATATPSPTGGQTPTPTGGAQLTQGDNDCDGDVDAVDALVSLQSTAALPYNQQPDCLGLGAAVPAGGEAQLFGDIDCDGDVDAVDALQILRFVAGLLVNQGQGCPAVGELF